jgi:secreted trypsin-like serine protease
MKSMLQMLRAASILAIGTHAAHAIQAGGEFDLPTDFPSQRLDDLSSSSSYAFAGALGISSGGSNYFGSGVALSQHWVLSAAHNVDFNDDGLPDSGLTIDFNLPGFGTYTASSYQTNPSFTGFGNPTVHNDLALLYFADPLPGLAFPALGLSMEVEDQLDLVGFGRSGFGSYGYTTNASLTDRRTGANVVDTFEAASSGTGLLFRYDFDDSDTFGTVGGSLGNDIETIIGPGDSGGPALVEYGSGYALVGINSFTEGFGGLFGDIGGGVALNDQWGWISETTGLSLVPEPSRYSLWLFCMVLFGLSSARRF